MWDNLGDYQKHYRTEAQKVLRKMGFMPSEDIAPYNPKTWTSDFIKQQNEEFDKNLQCLWRKPGCRRDPSEIIWAVIDALTQEGIAAWPGDATSIVEQIVRVQYDRAEKAEKELVELKSGK